MLPLREYWQAIANAIDAEEKKASIFIRHRPSIGVAREAILRDLLAKHTPEPYRVSTGFIYQFNTAWWNSRQCDVLVYDPTICQPDYAIGGADEARDSAGQLSAVAPGCIHFYEGRPFFEQLQNRARRAILVRNTRPQERVVGLSAVSQNRNEQTEEKNDQQYRENPGHLRNVQSYLNGCLRVWQLISQRLG